MLCCSGDSGGVRGARRSRAARRGMQTASGARTSALRRRGRMQVAVQCAGGFAAHRMDRKPDWKVFLNMAAARVSGSHTSALRPGPCRARGRASAATPDAQSATTGLACPLAQRVTRLSLQVGGLACCWWQQEGRPPLRPRPLSRGLAGSRPSAKVPQRQAVAPKSRIMPGIMSLWTRALVQSSQNQKNRDT